MSKLQAAQMTRFAAIAAFAAAIGATQGFAQETAPLQMNLRHRTIPWQGGTAQDALVQAAAGATIPMAPYAIFKDGTVYSGLIVGADPWAPPRNITIDAVVIPTIVRVVTDNGVTVFDPTKPDPCDGHESAEYRFMHSPLVVPTEWTLNGVKIGNVQYIDASMRAEFWNATPYGKELNDHIHWTLAPALTLPDFYEVGTFKDATIQKFSPPQSCGERATILDDIFENAIEYVAIPQLQNRGVISPGKFAFFLLRDVATSPAFPLLSPGSGCCIGGEHSATGSPGQTYAWADYDTTGTTAPDVAGASHEIGEWMNDPLGTNPTPPWGYIGQDPTTCQTTFEVGDPLTGTYLPYIVMSGRAYHVQELAFISWFFDAPGHPSWGAGGKFSGNGTFTGPAKNCPPGGTH